MAMLGAASITGVPAFGLPKISSFVGRICIPAFFASPLANRYVMSAPDSSYAADPLHIVYTVHLTFDFPARFLQQGQNKIVLTAVDESAARDDETNPGITYDALSLEQESAGKYAVAAVNADVEPTVFYVSQASGLAELIDVYVRYNSPLKSGEVALTVDGKKVEHALTPGADFGEQLAELPVPEFAPSTTVELAVTLNGKTHRSSVVLTPAKKWIVFAVPHEHIDVGYPDYQSFFFFCRQRHDEFFFFFFVPRSVTYSSTNTSCAPISTSRAGARILFVLIYNSICWATSRQPHRAGHCGKYLLNLTPSMLYTEAAGGVGNVYCTTSDEYVLLSVAWNPPVLDARHLVPGRHFIRLASGEDDAISEAPNLNHYAKGFVSRF